MLSMMALPELVRNVVVIGHMQHGKTSFVDNLVGGAIAMAALVTATPVIA